MKRLRLAKLPPSRLSLTGSIVSVTAMQSAVCLAIFLRALETRHRLASLLAIASIFIAIVALWWTILPNIFSADTVDKPKPMAIPITLLALHSALTAIAVVLFLIVLLSAPTP